MKFAWLAFGFFLMGCGAQKTPDPQHTPNPPVISIPKVVDAGAK